MSDDTTAPVTAEDTRGRLVDALIDSWDMPAVRRSRMTREAATRDVDTILAALAADPGNLRERTIEAMREHYLSTNRDAADADGNLPCVCGGWREPGLMGSDEDGWDSHLAEVALSVRSEEGIRQAARLAKALAELEHAEGELDSVRDHNIRWQTEKARADRAEAERNTARNDRERMEQDLADALDERDEARQRAEQAEAEVERLHTWDGLLSLLDGHWPEDIFPTGPDSEARDSGPRVVSLLRWVERLRADDDIAQEAIGNLNMRILKEIKTREKAEADRDEAQRRGDQYHDEAEHWAGRVVDLEAERAALKTAIAEVRRLQEMTIAASCRAQAIDQAHDTLAVLDRILGAPAAPETPERRCTSCDHLASIHHSEGCWYTVATGPEDRDLVCPCTVQRAPETPGDAER